MNKQEQRIAIAKACGKKVRKITYNRGLATSWVSETNEPIPDYLNDLNAMHEAEKVLDDDQLYSMLLNLKNNTRSMVSGTAIMTATAAQRAEAFLKTLNLWKD